MAQQNRGKPPLQSASDWIDLEVPTRLPIIPLVSSVLFPGGVLSLQVGIDRNVRLLKALPDDQNLIAAFCQKTGDKENPRPEDLSNIGVLAAIVQRLPLSSDRYQLFLQGRQRVELVQMLQTEPYFEARLREVAPRPIPKSVKTDALMNKAMSLFEKLVESDSKYSSELLNILRMNMAEGPDTFADLLSSFVNVPLEEKQLLLETVNPIERIEYLIESIQRDLGKATVDRELQRQIQTSIDRLDREDRGSPRSQKGGRDSRPEAPRSGESEGARPRVPGRAQVEGRSQRPDPLLRRPARRGQDLPRRGHCRGVRPEVRADGSGRG